MASHHRTTETPRDAIPYVVFVTVETTLTDGSKVYDVCLRNTVDGSLSDVEFCESEYAALALASKLNNALLRDKYSPKTGYASAASRIGDGCPG